MPPHAQSMKGNFILEDSVLANSPTISKFGSMARKGRGEFFGNHGSTRVEFNAQLHV